MNVVIDRVNMLVHNHLYQIGMTELSIVATVVIIPVIFWRRNPFKHRNPFQG